ncbi:single-stranded-DNA-specific exonuclease RecJ [Brevibacillus sp. SYSU BS000544]|uniref:single-stranded-DNA-specific exonuclease RecJ n=1 Tax=Brevibacillus sp. SYSU BS000544 TaxID=3416443 RepID=UPI003CE46C99
MLQAKSRWQLTPYDEKASDTIARECGISPLLAKLLVIRGIDTVERAHAFLNVNTDQFHDPYLLDGMKQAVDRIRLAIETKEPICLYGDYDADGVSSTTLMIHVMRQLGAVFDYYIPNRFTEGYGLNVDAITTIHERGFKLIITVDTGISAVEQVAHANQLGLDVIVTDHHEPPDILPDAYAVINPKKPGCSYPFDMLAGVGVAFKLAHALFGEPPMHLADLAAIGTIGDLVPLVDENRLLATYGLQKLNRTTHIGMKALIRVCGLDDKELTAGHVGFAIAPRINAGGRLETAEAAVKLLIETDMTQAEQYARTLDQLNQERQELVQLITVEAEEMVLQHYPPGDQHVLVLAKEGWNPGVVGIVASRMVEKFYRPTIILCIDPVKGTAKGSARSIAGFDLYEALTSCKELLPHYGGHTMAAGMTLPVDNVEQLRTQLNQYARQSLTEEDLIPLARVDLSMSIDDVKIDTIEAFEKLAPFGMGNPTPVVMIKDVSLAGLRKIGRDDSHLKCSLARSSVAVDAIGFSMAHVSDEITPSAVAEVIGELSINEWNGNRKPQFVMKDIAIRHRQLFDWRGMKDKEKKWMELSRQTGVLTVFFQEDHFQKGQESVTDPLQINCLFANDLSALQQALREYDVRGSRCHSLVFYDLPKQKAVLEQILRAFPDCKRIYVLFGDGNQNFDKIDVPTRDQFKRLYQVFHQHRTITHIQLDALAKKLDWKRKKLDAMIAVFTELGILQKEEQQVSLHPEPTKNSLDHSRLYADWKEEANLATELLLSSQEELSNYMNQWMVTAVS